jgi:hypothetical protein
MTFGDTSASLDPETAYAYIVKSESTSYVQSDPSSITHARPAKTRIVQSPQHVEWRYLDDGTLMLFWEDLQRTDPYITKYLVATTDSASAKYQLIPKAVIDVKNNTWIQTEKLKAGTYYCVIAEDAWDNRSACSVPVQPMTKPVNTTPGIILVQPNAKGHMLFWGIPEDKSVESVRLYESTEKGQPVLVKSFPPATASYLLPTVKRDQPKAYYLTYGYKGGMESQRGEEVIIK